MKTLKISRIVQLVLLAGASLTLGACSTQSVKSTEITDAITTGGNIPEEELLDVGIGIFDPGLDDIPDNRQELTFGDVRIAETYYVSHMVTQTLQQTGNWGVVRVIPAEDDMSSNDVSVNGTIIQSDGETMVVDVTVTDASGRTWFQKEYEEVVSQYNYDPGMTQRRDAFQGLYNRIANDMLRYRRENLSRDQILALRQISEVQFAAEFAPEVYDEYLRETDRGRIEVARLPAENDPIMNRVRAVRERNYLYVDTMQQYYSNFARQMDEPYTEFRRLSYEEVMALDRQRTTARRNMILGIASILGGLAATQADGSLANAGVFGGISVGGWLIRDAFQTNEEAQMHVEAVAELGRSLESEVAPHTIELEERSVTLSGSVEEQYDQWRQILLEMYANETGQAVSSNM